MRNVATHLYHLRAAKYYNFLIINATFQKAHHTKKKA
jgi:hypothetical protein